MRIAGRETTPDPEAPWHEIVPELWMGGHLYGDATGQRVRAVVAAEFDVVISLFQADGHGPGPDVEHHYLNIPDGALRPEEIGAARALAAVAAAAVRARRRVLVRCQFGYNRSGLVVAQTLVDLGYSIDEALDLIRGRRSAWALHNALFVDYLVAGLDSPFRSTDLA